MEKMMVPSKDKLFDPSVDMLVNDFDDERTLEEEEALAAGELEDPNAELAGLEKESNMPLDELLALYGLTADNTEEDEEQEGDDEEEDEEEEDEGDDEQSEAQMMDDQEIDSGSEPQDQPSKLSALYDEPMRGDNDQDVSRLLRSVSSSRVSEEEEEDYDYSPDEEEWRKVNKTIMVGSDYQAQIPEGLCHYDDALPYENEDKLLWDPNQLEPEVTEEYLRKAAEISKAGIGDEGHLRDDEKALYLLQQCGFNTEEALRRLKMIPSPEAMSIIWSEEECRNFESGIRTYGKNFHLIHENKVRTRSVGELVQFYYLWKKTERHDLFSNKARLEKKKYALHPGYTDYMDRFLEDQDVRDRSSSPSVQVLVPETKKPAESSIQGSKLSEL